MFLIFNGFPWSAKVIAGGVPMSSSGCLSTEIIMSKHLMVHQRFYRRN